MVTPDLIPNREEQSWMCIKIFGAHVKTHPMSVYCTEIMFLAP